LTDKTLEEQVGPVLGPLVQALGDYILRRMERGANDPEWVSQHGSELTPRVHCRRVRELVEAGEHERARIRGKRKELRRDAYEEAKALRAKPPVKAEDKGSKWDRRLGGQ
jgi:hypothetical protein